MLIGLHYVWLWWLTRTHIATQQQIRRYQTIAGKIILTALFLPALLLPVYFFVDRIIVFPRLLERVQTDSNKLIQALESFHTRTGKYPTTLDELAPLELDTVPRLPGGETFGYVSGDDWFSLTYGYSDMGPITCRYGSGSLGWYCD